MNFFLWSEASKNRHNLTMKQEPIQPFLFYSFLEFSQASVVLDIGANVGVYSLLSVLSESVNRVYAFEPDKAAYKELLKNIRLNAADKIVQVSEHAVSDREGVLRFGSHAPMAGVNAIIDTSIHDTEIFKEFSEVKCIRIDLINGLKGQVLGLKIDVEGHEINVINGARQTLQNTPAFLQVEHYAGDDIDHVLAEIGYFRFFASGHDHYFTNIRNFANPEFVKRAVEHAGTCLVESQTGRWPERKTIKDSISISVECQKGKISASVIKDDRFFGDDAEYAFYLLENGKKVDEQWYTPKPHVEFPYSNEAETIEVKGFIREASFPEKKVALGEFVKSPAVGYRATTAAADSLGAPSQYATLAARITGGQLGYPDVEVREMLCSVQCGDFSGVLQLGAGLVAWPAAGSVENYNTRSLTVLLPQGQARPERGMNKASYPRVDQLFSSCALCYVNTPEQVLETIFKVARKSGGSLCVVLRDQFIFDLGEDLSFLDRVFKLLPKGSSLYAEGFVNTTHRKKVLSRAADFEIAIGWLYPKSMVLSSCQTLQDKVGASEGTLGLIFSDVYDDHPERVLGLDFSWEEDKDWG